MIKLQSLSMSESAYHSTGIAGHKSTFKIMFTTIFTKVNFGTMLAEIIAYTTASVYSHNDLYFF